MTAPLCDVHGEGKIKSKCKGCDAAYMRAYHRKRFATDPAYQERVRAKTKAWAKQNPEKRKQANVTHRLKKYGISHEEHAALLLAQGSACGICKQVVRLDIDHDHESKLVRGLLCRKCNLGLGLIESSEKLAAAQAYLSSTPYSNL